jgi:hypothetical protein
VRGGHHSDCRRPSMNATDYGEVDAVDNSNHELGFCSNFIRSVSVSTIYTPQIKGAEDSALGMWQS